MKALTGQTLIPGHVAVIQVKCVMYSTRNTLTPQKQASTSRDKLLLRPIRVGTPIDLVVSTGFTHRFRGAALHESSEGDRTPEDAREGKDRPILARQHLKPTPILVLLWQPRLRSPHHAACSVAKSFLPLSRQRAKHDRDHCLPNHATNGTRWASVTRRSCIQCTIHEPLSPLIQAVLVSASIRSVPSFVLVYRCCRPPPNLGVLPAAAQLCPSHTL